MGRCVPSAIITRVSSAAIPAASRSSRIGGSSKSAGVSRVMSSIRTRALRLAASRLAQRLRPDWIVQRRTNQRLGDRDRWLCRLWGV